MRSEQAGLKLSSSLVVPQGYSLPVVDVAAAVHWIQGGLLLLLLLAARSFCCCLLMRSACIGPSLPGFYSNSTWVQGNDLDFLRPCGLALKVFYFLYYATFYSILAAY